MRRARRLVGSGQIKPTTSIKDLRHASAAIEKRRHISLRSLPVPGRPPTNQEIPRCGPQTILGRCQGHRIVAHAPMGEVGVPEDLEGPDAVDL
jgi:hypothetical protein